MRVQKRVGGIFIDKDAKYPFLWGLRCCSKIDYLAVRDVEAIRGLDCSKQELNFR